MRPASSALARSVEMNWPQPASLILRLSPDFARAPLGRNCPGFSTSGTDLARRTMLAIARSSTTTRSYRSTIAGLFVVKVLALIGDLAVPRRNRLPFGVPVTAAAAREPAAAGPQSTGQLPAGPSEDYRCAARRWWWRN